VLPSGLTTIAVTVQGAEQRLHIADRNGAAFIQLHSINKPALQPGNEQ
jgi:hypothetical protein